MQYKSVFKSKSILTLIVTILSLNSSFADNEERDIERLAATILTNLEGIIESGKLPNYQPQSLIPSLLLLNAHASQITADNTQNSEQAERVGGVLNTISTLYFTESRWRALATDSENANTVLLHLVNLQIVLQRALEKLNLPESSGFFLDSFVRSLKTESMRIITSDQSPPTEIDKLRTNWNLLLSIYRLRHLSLQTANQAFNAMGVILTKLRVIETAGDTSCVGARASFETQYERYLWNSGFSAIQNLVTRAKEQLTNSNPLPNATYSPLVPIEVLISIATAKTEGTWPEASLMISAREGLLGLLAFIETLPNNGNNYATTTAINIRRALETSHPPYDPALFLGRSLDNSNRSNIADVIQRELQAPANGYRIVLVNILGRIPETGDLSEQQIHGILTQLLFSSEISRDMVLARHIFKNVLARKNPLGLKVMQSAVESPHLTDELRIEALRMLIQSEGTNTPYEFVATKEAMDRIVALAQVTLPNLKFAIRTAFLLIQESNESGIPRLEQMAMAAIATLQTTKNQEQLKLIDTLLDSHLKEMRATSPSARAIQIPTVKKTGLGAKGWFSWLFSKGKSREPRPHR